MLVGRIVNHDDACLVHRGQEKGLFQYGGSTIIVLAEKDAVSVRHDLLEHSKMGVETPVKMGECIAFEKLDKKTHS